MDSILELKNVSSGYKDKIVIKDINFKVKRGEFIGLIGPNGAGKTTLFKTLMGILRPDRGEILYGEMAIIDIPLKERARRIAFLPQIFETRFSYTVEEFIAMGRFPHQDGLSTYSKEDLERVKDVIGRFSLTDIRDRRIDELSGGELQRVLFAQSIAQDPELLLLDEPTTHLDIGHQLEIMNSLSDLNQEGLTVIAILHDLNISAEFCDRLILMDKGRVARDGEPSFVMDYNIIEEVYNARVVIRENPYSGKPFLILYRNRA
ncbi:MAG: ABC transporter ATP-binding protein [Candidatus Kaelpia imicola]|nr:ABC transporter ATP-binding protein [Candidatus Kaelpia imicola]